MACGDGSARRASGSPGSAATRRWHHGEKEADDGVRRHRGRAPMSGREAQSSGADPRSRSRGEGSERGGGRVGSGEWVRGARVSGVGWLGVGQGWAGLDSSWAGWPSGGGVFLSFF